MGLSFVPFPGPSSSGDQVLGERGCCALYWHAFSGVLFVSPGELISAATLQAEVNHPESQELSVSSRACLQFGRGCLSGARIAPFQLWMLPALRLSPAEDGPVCSPLALLWYSLSPLFCERAWQCLRLGLFTGQFFLSFWLSHSLGCYLKLVPSDCPQGIRNAAHPPCSAPACWWRL